MESNIIESVNTSHSMNFNRKVNYDILIYIAKTYNFEKFKKHFK